MRQLHVPKNILRFFAVLCACALALSSMPTHAAVREVFPKRANYFLSWTITLTQARELAKWDLLILDAETQENSRDALALIRQLNPRVVMLAYVTSQDMRDDIAGLRDVAPLRYARYEAMPDAWYLKNEKGTRLSWWSRTYLLNVSSRAPVVNGTRFNDYLAYHVAKKILASGWWDGVFYDNAWEQISYFAGEAIDIDGDGLRDSSADADSAWRQGMEDLFAKTRQYAGNGAIIVGNGHAIIGGNGVLYENFPANGWGATIQEYRALQREARAPFVSVINGNTGDIPSPQWYQAFRFGLGSTLLGNGYFSFDDGAARHESLWWYDEYDAYLGAPNTIAYRIDPLQPGDGVWRRDFTNGIVLVNANAAPTIVSVEDGFEGVRGTQDTKANTGAAVRSLTLAAQDARILMRRVETISRAPYRVGVSTQVYTASGREVRQRFVPEVRSCIGAGVVSAQIVSDERCVSSDRRFVTVRTRTGAVIAYFAPYGASYVGGISLAIAQGSDGTARIVTAAQAGAPRVRVWSLDGRTMHADFLAYAPQMRSGVTLAVGDREGDGTQEIITGTGDGGGAHVRFFSLDGLARGGDFFAYDARGRSGVRVAAGDVDGDGDDDIITVPAGRRPLVEVRVFAQSDHTTWNHFTVGSSGARIAVYPVAVDIDQDGRAEVLLQSDKMLLGTSGSAK